MEDNRRLLFISGMAFFTFVISIVSFKCSSERKEKRECSIMFRESCISCHSFINRNLSGVITYKEMFDLPKDSFEYLMEKAIESHDNILKDTLVKFRNCSYSPVNQ